MEPGDPGTITGFSIILFDAACPLCTRSAHFIVRNDPAQRFRFAALQSPAGKELIKQAGIPEVSAVGASLVLVSEGQWFRASDAALEISRVLQRPWCWFAHFRWVPFWLREWVYRMVANHRPRVEQACVLGDDLDARMVPDGKAV
jgi:predicted DCC family thiol-disulfide oxidoreductase YuxK